MSQILVPYHLDEYLPALDVPLAPDRTITRDFGRGDVWQHMASLYGDVAEMVADSARAGARPVVMSGDCTTSYGVVAGLQRADVQPSIVWFDAHGDVQTLETTTSGYIGGFPLRILTGYRPELIADDLGLRPAGEANVLLVDARDLDEPEREFLATSPMRRVDVDAVSPDVVPPGPVYLHVDLDVVDPTELPQQLFPAEGGPSVDRIARAVAAVVATGRVAAVGLACTWHPDARVADRVAGVVEALSG